MEQPERPNTFSSTDSVEQTKWLANLMEES